MDIGNSEFTGPQGTRSFLRDEQGFEAYYNCAVTPWVKVTPDIQVRTACPEAGRRFQRNDPHHRQKQHRHGSVLRSPASVDFLTM